MAEEPAATDWQAWHTPYADPGSPLSRRLRVVQHHIADWLERRRGAPSRVVSLCAGDGRDLLQVLVRRTGRDRVEATLVELDPGLVAAARRHADGLPEDVRVRVVEGDAGRTDHYLDATPADLVLLCGVLGNISDDDVLGTVAALPGFCAAGATVIWTRSRREPDLTPVVRESFSRNGFDELAFHAPEDAQWSVGVHRFTGRPRDVPAGRTLFTFVR